MKKKKTKQKSFTSNPRHFVDFGLAMNYIHNFISNYPSIASRSIGGFLDIDSILTIFENKLQNVEKGIIFWHGYNQFSFNYPYHFAAFADKNNFDTARPDDVYPAATEYYVNQFTHFFAEELTPGNLYSFLTEPLTDTSMPCKNINYDEIVSFNNKYSNSYPPSNTNFFYNTNKYGFFIEEDTGLLELIYNSDKNIVGVNYYFGVDYMRGRICLILFAVDENKRNVISNDDGTPAVILEKSYP